MKFVSVDGFDKGKIRVILYICGYIFVYNIVFIKCAIYGAIVCLIFLINLLFKSSWLTVLNLVSYLSSIVCWMVIIGISKILLFFGTNASKISIGVVSSCVNSLLILSIFDIKKLLAMLGISLGLDIILPLMLILSGDLFFTFIILF